MGHQNGAYSRSSGKSAAAFPLLSGAATCSIGTGASVMLIGPPSMESWPPRGKTVPRIVLAPGGTPGGSGVSRGSGSPGATSVTVDATLPHSRQRYVALAVTTRPSSRGPGAPPPSRRDHRTRARRRARRDTVDVAFRWSLLQSADIRAGGGVDARLQLRSPESRRATGEPVRLRA